MSNEEFIRRELDWLLQVILLRLKLYFDKVEDVGQIGEVAAQDTAGAEGPYPGFIVANGLGVEDRLYLALMLAPSLRPEIMDCFNVKNSTTGSRFVEFGCVDMDSRGVFPSLNTVLFLLAGGNLEARIPYIRHFTQHPVFSGSLFRRSTAGGIANGFVEPTVEFFDRFVLGRPFRPEFSSDFPAKLITTSRSWEDLVLDPKVMRQVEEIKLWLRYGDIVLDELALRGKVKDGYRALFYGPSGTGKTFTASLLGKVTGRDVYKVDLSLVVSKYIGETEKNLSNIFAQAEDRGWILFFDEADALFGKRSEIKDAHDRYANQEVSYLLQRVEDYRGLVILATNQKTNMDEAFTRRFQNVIRFPMPDAKTRMKLWKGSFSDRSILDKDIDLAEISAKYEMSGGAILNVVHFCSLMSVANGSRVITLETLKEGIVREFRKEGRFVD